MCLRLHISYWLHCNAVYVNLTLSSCKPIPMYYESCVNIINQAVGVLFAAGVQNEQLFCVACRIPGRYSHTTSDRLGRTSSKEQYSYVYRY